MSSVFYSWDWRTTGCPQSVGVSWSRPGPAGSVTQVRNGQSSSIHKAVESFECQTSLKQKLKSKAARLEIRERQNGTNGCLVRSGLHTVLQAYHGYYGGFDGTRQAARRRRRTADSSESATAIAIMRKTHLRAASAAQTAAALFQEVSNVFLVH